MKNKIINSNGQWLLIVSALLITCYSVHSSHFTKSGLTYSLNFVPPGLVCCEAATDKKFYLRQVDEVLSKDSSEEIADGKTPGPMTEINFWEAKCINLESLFDQETDLLLKAHQLTNKYFLKGLSSVGGRQ